MLPHDPQFYLGAGLTLLLMVLTPSEWLISGLRFILARIVIGCGSTLLRFTLHADNRRHKVDVSEQQPPTALFPQRRSN